MLNAGAAITVVSRYSVNSTRGMRVLIRLMAVSCAVTLAGGCANERATTVFAVQPMAANASAMATGSVTATERDVELRQAAKQTIAGKVLAAIALERVTGRKPDPARLAELR